MTHVNSAKARSLLPPTNRTVFIGNTPITKDDNKQNLHDNRIVTSKYTLITFLPKNLFEQFRRIANFYFLCVGLIQSATNSLVSPATSLVPLTFMVITTAVKQGYEDYLRHQHDNATNRKKVTVLTANAFSRNKRMDIRIGDIVKVSNDEEFPCDLLMLSCSDDNGTCHITTANLDGETNLKDRMCLPITKNLKEASDFEKFNATIEYENPNTDLYEFKGVMRVYESDKFGPSNDFSLGLNNLLLRGARLKNTAFIFGVAIYTGKETKMALNSKSTSNKFSSIETTVNKYLFAYFIILLSMTVICTIVRLFIRNNTNYKGWYLKNLPYYEDSIRISTILQESLSFFVIFNYLIPISLYVALELVKFFGSKTFVGDKNLFNDDERPICNSSDLNEDLGQVEYLFSDKTGTLTENTMEFRACSINGQLYEEKDNRLIDSGTGQMHDFSQNPEMQWFWRALTLCNTVQVIANDIITETNETKRVYEYQSSSPDEKALVEACHKFGVTLTDISDKSSTIMIGSKVERYETIDVFHFDSHRKRMSVIVKNENGEYILICKGSDSTVKNLCKNGKIKETLEHADMYSCSGLRILIVAMKMLTPDEYATIQSQLYDASLLIENRNEKINALQTQFEYDLTILGATAVEDRLQEDVRQTIIDLKDAGIKVWVLTGDKLETAVSIGHSCGLLHDHTKKLMLERQKDSDSCEVMLNRHLATIEKSLKDSRRDEYAFILDGRSAHMAMKFIEKFRKMCENCSVVLCCRMSPIQKAEVIRLVKESPSCPVTAAIGDGANDVSMLQEAHVGIGIMGREGRQAVNSSDFAFSKFKFVKRTLLVHGHYFYRRVSFLIQFFFYKNVVFIMPQFLFAFFNGFTAQTLYHSMILMLFNTILTAAPIFVYGLTEKHLPSIVLLSFPQLYKNIRGNANMTPTKFMLWFCTGIWHGSVAFFGFQIIFGSSKSVVSDGDIGGLFSFGILVLHVVICVVTFKLMIVTRNWDCTNLLTAFITLLLLPTILSIYTNYKWDIIDDELFGIYNPLCSSLSFWLSVLLITTIAVIPDISYVVMSNAISSKSFAYLLTEKNKKNADLY